MTTTETVFDRSVNALVKRGFRLVRLTNSFEWGREAYLVLEKRGMYPITPATVEDNGTVNGESVREFLASL